MLKYVVLFTTVFCLVQSQRPWHAGSSNRFPQVLPQYIDERIAAEQAQAAQAAQGAPVSLGNPAVLQGAPAVGAASAADGTVLGNRIGDENGFNIIASPPSTIATTTTTINPLDLPVDAHGDIDLINRIKTWPRDKQPFWYINWQAIQAHRGDVSNNQPQPTQTQQPDPTSSIAV